jgi:hypothetical protein
MSAIRRLAPSALLLACALLLTAPPALARENPSTGTAGGWFEVAAQQLVQWAAGWLMPAYGSATGQVVPAKRPSARPRPPVSVDCGTAVDPNGCLAPALGVPH